jgi:hypothetical protein
MVEVLERRRDVAGFSAIAERSAAIELVVATGPRAYYGALGATFMPASTMQLVARVPLSEHAGRILVGSLAGRADVARVGLPGEFAHAVAAGLLSDDASGALGSGTVCCRCAAWAPVGSSAWLFEGLGRLVVKLLSLDRQSASEETLMSLVQAELGR